MVDTQHTVSLGFTEEQFPAGTHICQIYGDEAEREDSLMKYVLSGLQAEERTTFFSDKTGVEKLSAFLAENGVSYEDAEKAGLISVAGSRETYLQDGKFDPDRTLKLLAEHYENSVADGCPAARLSGELPPAIIDTPGGERMCEYEARINILVRDKPLTVVCQYDVEAFGGTIIMDVLKVHPMMIVRGAVVRNPFFMQPEEFLSGIK